MTEDSKFSRNREKIPNLETLPKEEFLFKKKIKVLLPIYLFIASDWPWSSEKKPGISPEDSNVWQ